MTESGPGWQVSTMCHYLYEKSFRFFSFQYSPWPATGNDHTAMISTDRSSSACLFRFNFYPCSGPGVTESTIPETRDGGLQRHESAVFLSSFLTIFARTGRNDTKRTQDGGDPPRDLLFSWLYMILSPKSDTSNCYNDLLLLPASFWAVFLSVPRAAGWRFGVGPFQRQHRRLSLWTILCSSVLPVRRKCGLVCDAFEML